MSMPIIPIPEQGQIVSVRQRRYVVTDVVPSRLPAPAGSGIEIAKYQLSPLVRAVQLPRVNLLIADDVGLGKTVEAGWVMQELILLGSVRTALIVCPAGLQIHYRLRSRFWCRSG